MYEALPFNLVVATVSKMRSPEVLAILPDVLQCVPLSLDHM